jgi:hypothetical protein
MRTVAGDPVRSQAPRPGTLNVDHIAHFVPQLDSASRALVHLGFTLTPYSAQSHRLEPGGPLVPAGTGNRCVMLDEGYLEFLTPTGNTPVANQLRTALQRYTGAHLIAFGTAAPDLDHSRLAKAGFQPLAPVSLERSINTPSGPDTARFTVVRVPPGTMAEGRIQYCRHHTPGLLWQKRWLEHANRAAALRGVLLCVEDPQEAAQRYARFTGLLPHVSGGIWRMDTARGYLLFLEPSRCESRFGCAPPAQPWIAGCVLGSSSLSATRTYLRDAGIPVNELQAERFSIALPPELGGLIVFEPIKAHPFTI